MFGRREIIFGGTALAVLPAAARAALPVPASNRLGFDIVRKGTKLGTHELNFERHGGDLLVTVAVDLVFKLGFITLYRYSHRATERWSGDQLAGLETTTNDDGGKFSVTGRREGGSFFVTGTKATRYAAPADALPATHWNRRQLNGPWINTQDGRLFRPKVAPQGTDTIPSVAGVPIRASHFVLTGDVQLDMWYDAAPAWAGLRFKAKDGSQVQYERQ